jgi:transcriptional regulator with XRE-family HTH domain
MTSQLSNLSTADVMRSIEARRLELEVTPAELARRSGVSRRTLNACLSGHTDISLRRLLRIAAALCLTLQLAPEPECERFSTAQIQVREDRA